MKFLSRGPGYTVFLSPTEAALALSRRPGRDPETVLRMHLLGADPAAQAVGEETLPGRVNYLIGRDPAKWHRDVPTYARVRYERVYPGIDLIYYGNPKQLEYDFIVSPGAEASAIAIDVTGGAGVTKDGNGDMRVRVPGGEVRLRRPSIYQEADGVRHEIAGAYVLKGTRIGFRVGAYDHDRPLVIDPAFDYATYVGGQNQDEGNAIAIDALGNAYLAGETFSSTFPPFAAQQQIGAVTPASGDVFVAKLDPTGSALLYLTYIGGSSEDRANAIAVDSQGVAYVAGMTGSINFPTTPDALKNQGGDSASAFLFKLSPDGSALAYSTVIGGANGDEASGIAVHPTFGVFISGGTASPPSTQVILGSFPVTPDAYQKVKKGVVDAFVMRFDLSVQEAGSLVYSTLLSGTGGDQIAESVAVDADGNAAVTGYTQSATFPVVNGLPQKAFGTHGFVTSLTVDGSALRYSTYLSGSITENFGLRDSGIAVGGNGHLFVTGTTASNDFPITANAFQKVYAGNDDAFVVEIDPLQSGLASIVYASYLGGAASDVGTAIAVDATGNAWVTGYTISSNFPTTSCSVQKAKPGSQDTFMTRVNADGTGLVFSTYVGGAGADFGLAIAIDDAGNAFVAGTTDSTAFPTTQGAFQETGFSGCNGCGFHDAFVAKIPTAECVADLTLRKIANPDPVLIGGMLTYTIGVANVGPSTAENVTITDTLPDGVSLISAVPPCSAVGQTLTCNVGSVAVGPPATETIIVKVIGPVPTGTLTNTASVTSDQTDPDPSNNTRSVTTIVATTTADLSITKSGAPDPVVAGNPLTYTLTVTNNGPETAKGIAVKDLLPPDVIFNSASSGCVPSGAEVNCTVDDLAAGASAIVTIIVVPTEGLTLNNVAFVSSTSLDTNGSNNAATAQTIATPAADLSIASTGNPPSVIAGNAVTYIVTVTNDGPSTATGVTVTDEIVGNAVVLSAPGCVGSPLVCQAGNGNLPSGAGAVFTIKVLPLSGTTLTNTATAKGTEFDPFLSDNSTKIVTAVTPAADVTIKKTASANPSNVGSLLTYAISVKNNGPSTATNVVVTDPLPGGAKFFDAPGCSGPPNITCNLGNMPSGGTAVVYLKVWPTTPGTLINTAAVTHGELDPNTSDNTATVQTTVPPAADLSVTKIGQPSTVPLGTKVTYTITVTNNGPSAAANVVMTDQLPAGLTFVSVTPGLPTCSQLAGKVTCSYPSLASGVSKTVTIVATANAIGAISNTANVKSDTFDPAKGNNAFTQTTTVYIKFALLIEKIQTFLQSGLFNAGQAQSLLAKIDAVSRQSAAGNDAVAPNLIGAFVNEVQALQRSGRLDAASAAALIELATGPGSRQ